MNKNSSCDCILTVNGGSSSIKFALFNHSDLRLFFSGVIENIGRDNTQLKYEGQETNPGKRVSIQVESHTDAANYLINFLENEIGFSAVTAIGHRIVHGMEHSIPERISDKLLEELKQISAYAPEHLPAEIKLIEAFSSRFPKAIQIACFDSAFHASMPNVAKLLPIPRRYITQGIHRYGFHGISFSWLMHELSGLENKTIVQGRIILAHLGNGASMAAVKDGKSVDTSMGFTPASGLMMGTRTGELDPGVAWYLMQQENLTPGQFSQVINHQSGLLGVSDLTSDMRELLKRQQDDPRAAEAIALFCYQAKKWIGSFAAVLDGLDTLVFSGGIGENSPEIRERICRSLTFLGIELDEERNSENEVFISSENSKVSVRVIRTNEELMIATMVNKILIEQNL